MTKGFTELSENEMNPVEGGTDKHQAVEDLFHTIGQGVDYVVNYAEACWTASKIAFRRNDNLINFKGCLKNLNDLPETELPEKAVKFKEPSNTSLITLLLFLVGIVIFFTIYFCVIGLCKIKKCDFSGGLFNLYGILGLVMTILPHEFLHAIWYPKE